MKPDEFRKLVAAGLTTDQIALVMEMIEAKDRAFAEAEEARKSKGRDRVAKWREARNVTVTEQKVTERLVRERDTRAFDKPINTKIEPEEKNITSKDHAEFRAVLSELDADRLSALVKHRKAKKAQMTGHAARLFLKDVEACGISLSEAVDTCISRNWITVKPDWIAKPVPRGSPPQPNGKPRNIAEASARLVAQMKESTNANSQPRALSDRAEQDVPYLAAPNGQR